MKHPSFSEALIGAVLTSSVLGQATNYSAWMAVSQISRGQGIFTGLLGSSEYFQCGFTQKAFRAFIQQYPNGNQTNTIGAYTNRSIDSMIGPLGNASADVGVSLDRFSNGNGFITRFQETGNATYRQAADALRQSLNLQPRNSLGGLWYYVYPNWSYLDGLYSMPIFYTIYTNTFNSTNATARSDAALQLDLLYQNCQDNSTGLLVHGYDSSKTAVWANNITGASSQVWGRAFGWYFMGLVDYLQVVPQSEPSYNITLSRLQTFSSRLVALADPASGAWYQIVGQGNRTGNYIESSASSMFTYGLLKASRLGYLSNATIANNTTYRAAAVKAYRYLAQTFVVNQGNGTLGWNGTVAVCSLNSTATYEYYTGRPIEYNNVLGSNAFILASLEYERLNVTM